MSNNTLPEEEIQKLDENLIAAKLNLLAERLKSLKDLLENKDFCLHYFFQPLETADKNTIPSPMEEKRKHLLELIITALNKLKKPVITFTTLGTTNSGKSTLVNCLCGRLIAPVHSSETSAGEFRIAHKPGSSFLCRMIPFLRRNEKTPEIKEYTDSEQAYHAVSDEMKEYHKLAPNAKSKVKHPVFQIETSIKIGEQKAEFGIPEQIDVTFVDLPGMKNTADQANIKIIQNRLKDSFPIVCLDYLEADDDKRGKLISFLKGLFQDNGSAIFILNKFDQKDYHDKNGIPKEKLFQRDIKNILNLREEPTIIPMMARVLHLTELWIAGQIKDPNDLFTPVIAPIKGYIRQTYSGDEKKSLLDFMWLLEEKLEENEPLTEAEKARLLKIASCCSGYTNLQTAIRKRLAESFDSIVLKPIVGELLIEIEDFCAFAREQHKFYKDRREEDIKEIIRYSERIEQIVTEVSRDEKEKITNYFSFLLNDLLEILQNGGDQVETKINQKLKTASGKGYAENFTKCIGDINLDIIGKINSMGVNPFLDLFRTYCEDCPEEVVEAGIAQLQENFSKIPVSNHLEKFFTILNNCKKEPEELRVVYKIKGEDDDSDPVRRQIDRSLQDDFFQCIKLCSISVSKSILQRECNFLNDAITKDICQTGNSFLKNFKEKVRKEFSENKMADSADFSADFHDEIEKLFIDSVRWKIKISSKRAILNTDFVGDLFSDIEKTSPRRTIHSAPRVEEKLVKEGDCCTDPEYETVITEEPLVHFWSLAEMSRIWSKKINSQRPFYLEAIVNWSREVLKTEINNIFHSIQKHMDEQKMILNDRRNRIEKNIAQRNYDWNDLITNKLPCIENNQKSIKAVIGGNHE